MTLRQALEVFELLESPVTGAAEVRRFLLERGAAENDVVVTTVRPDQAGGVGQERHAVHFVAVTIRGMSGGPTLGVIGNLGGTGARPAVAGLVSDADGALCALTVAAKLLNLARAGDRLPGDVIVTTHVCPDAPIIPHDPVPFMGSPLDEATMARHEVSPAMDAILSVDATKANRVVNARGFAISPTVKEGWILRVSEDLLGLMAVTTGEAPKTFPVTMQDITPYGNGVFHLNSVMQPACATRAPVVGVAITTATAVPGCAGGANHETDIAEAARFMVEVAKAYGAGRLSFYDPAEFERLKGLYGDMSRLQGQGTALT